MNIKSKSVEVMNEVRSNEYYIDLFSKALKQNNMTFDSIRNHEHNEMTLIEMWNDFWYLLPDSPAIHCHPFNQVCDLVEHIFE